MQRRSLLTKLARGILTVWLIVTLSFAALNLSGDPIDALVGDQASPELIAHYREKFGLDRPLLAAIRLLSLRYRSG
jgi:peptide/nickel transport system permease protein